MPILSFAYVGVGVADAAAWCRFATDVLGFQDAGAGSDGQRRLRLDGRAWRIGVSAAPVNDIVYAGFEVGGTGELKALSERLTAAGISVRPLTQEQARHRSVQGGIAMTDPDGLPIEIVFGLAEADSPFRSPLDARFVTGDQGLGHMVVSTADADRSVAFYRLLGFEISDYIKTELAPGLKVTLVFLHCNERHHTLALLPLPTPKRLNHLMFELDSVDDVLIAYYRAQKQNVPIMRHMGRHTNDHMLSFYCQTPAGFDVEYGYGGRKVEGSEQIGQYDAISIWGHESR